MKTTSRLTTLAIFAIGAASLAQHAQAQSTITEWNFDNLTTGMNTAPAPSTGSGTASSVGMNQAYNGTQTYDISDVNTSTPLSNDPTAPNQQWRIRGGTSAGANTAATNGWSSNAPIGSQGAQFLASTVGYGSIMVSFDWSPTTQGEEKLQLQYTIDGTDYINVPVSLFTSLGAVTSSGNQSVAVTAATNTTSMNTVMGGYLIESQSTYYTDDIVANLSSITGAANNPNFGIRLVNASTGADDLSTAGTALNNTSGNWRFDEVTISGAAVPEPASLALAVTGLAGVGLFLRSRRQKVA